MKKLILALTSLALLTACSSSKWTVEYPDMPEQLRTKHQTILDENLEALKDAPDDAQILFEIAFRYQQLGDLKSAKKYYEETLKGSPSDVVSLNNLANIYEGVGKYDKAADLMMRLYEITPNSTEALKDVVRVLLKADRPVNAQEALDFFISQNRVVDDATKNAIDQVTAEIRNYLEEKGSHY